jgi:putative exosortase-associated protein (TIGR04073 family)
MLLAACAAGPVAAVQASDGAVHEHTAGDKLVRGLANIFLGFIEIPRNIHNTTAEDTMLVGWTVGLGKGLGYTGLRLLAGLYEVVTFPFPLPRAYAPLVEPEYVWQAPGPRYR